MKLCFNEIHALFALKHAVFNARYVILKRWLLKSMLTSLWAPIFAPSVKKKNVKMSRF